MENTRTAIATGLSDERAAQVYNVLNFIPMLWWAPMILAPRWRVTRALTTNRSLFAGLGLFYGAALLKAMAEVGLPNYSSLEDGPRRLLRSNTGLMAAWAHYLVFDLFVGIWIYRTGLNEDRSTRLPLLLTLMAGPLGLLAFLVQRGFGRPLPYPFDREPDE